MLRKFENGEYYEKHELEQIKNYIIDDFKYKNLQSKPIESHFVKTTNPLLNVKIPSMDEMLGDKITAFVLNTIGTLYRKVN